MRIEIDDNPLLNNFIVGTIIFIMLSGSFFAGFIMSKEIFSERCEDYIENYLNDSCQECFKGQYYVSNVTAPYIGLETIPNDTVSTSVK